MMPLMIEKLYLAKPRGFCAGVVMAIDAVKDAAAEARESGEGDIAVYHDIVHNRTVVNRLEDDHAVTFVERLDDLEDVEVNFDGITYAKGASVLKQLVAYVGREPFRDGLRAYFAKHAWGNTTLDDLLDEIDGVLETNAEDFVKSYVQKGGQ